MTYSRTEKRKKKKRNKKADRKQSNTHKAKLYNNYTEQTKTDPNSHI